MQQAQKISSIVILITGLFLTALAPNSAFATLTLTFPDNYYTPISSTAPKLYIGMTANNNYCQGLFCDSCTTSAQAFSVSTVCSLADVHPNDYITVLVSSSGDTNFSSGSLFYESQSGTWTQITTPSSPTQGSQSTAAGSFTSTTTATLFIPISQICAALGGTTACTQSITGNLSIGWNSTTSATSVADSNSISVAFRYVNSAGSTALATFPCSEAGTNLSDDDEGVCGFTPFPGDSKSYINSIQENPNNTAMVVPDLSGATSPVVPAVADPSGMTYSGLVIFASSTEHAFTTATNSAVIGIPVAGLSTGGNDYIDQLDNNTKYWLGMANIDQAGIMTFFDDTDQPVTPEPVYGLLNGQGCFIATAAYGSSLAPEVNTFREFRGKIMMRSNLGRWLSRTYYQFSPPVAAFISQSETLKFLSRLILWPTLMFVRLSLSQGFLFAVMVSAALLLSLVAGGLWWRKSRRSLA